MSRSLRNTLFSPSFLAAPIGILLVLAALGWAAHAQAQSSADSALPGDPSLAASAPAAAAQPASAPVQALSATPAQLVTPTTLLPPPQWQALSRTQRLALAPLERDWNGLDDTSKSKWLETVPRFFALPADEQVRVHERMRAWARLSPAQRQQARYAYHVALQIKADDRQAKWEAYQALPPEKRRELAEKAADKMVKQPIKPGSGERLGAQAKSNVIPAVPKLSPAKPVSPSVLQAKPGATTILITQAKAPPPAHQQAGQTKIFADPDLVDSKTLLPKHVASAPQSR